MNIRQKTVNQHEKLRFGETYHILNRAVSSDKLFISGKDYFYFLQKLDYFLLPWIDVIAYCLIPNHFHLLVNIKEKEKIPVKLLKRGGNEPEKLINAAFSNFFNSYAKSFNNVHKRKGRLFLYSFKRILVDKDDYLTSLICYIHRNPIHHGLTDDYESWKYSSYNAFLSNKPSKVNKEYVLNLFGSKKDFISFHKENITKRGLKDYLME